MVKHLQTQAELAYGLPQPLSALTNPPIAAQRAPDPTDTGYEPGQFWVNEPAGTAFILVSNAAGVATWLSVGGSLTPAVASITTGPAATSTLLAGNVWSATGTNAAIDLDLTPKGTGGVNVTTGALTVDAGDVVAHTSLVAETGYVQIEAAGSGIAIAEGANGLMGTAALVAGTQTIAIASVGANTRVFLSRSALNASPALGFLVADTSVAGQLTVTSYDDTGVLVATDVSSFNYLCIEAI
jgi:hypothetical protein